jgi:hypothetical protein
MIKLPAFYILMVLTATTRSFYWTPNPQGSEFAFFDDKAACSEYLKAHRKEIEESTVKDFADDMRCVLYKPERRQ